PLLAEQLLAPRLVLRLRRAHRVTRALAEAAQVAARGGVARDRGEGPAEGAGRAVQVDLGHRPDPEHDEEESEDPAHGSLRSPWEIGRTRSGSERRGGGPRRRPPPPGYTARVPAEELALGHLARPESRARAGVVVIHDVWGLSDHTRDLAGRLAAAGFAALAVNLYRRL